MKEAIFAGLLILSFSLLVDAQPQQAEEGKPSRTSNNKAQPQATQETLKEKLTTLERRSWEAWKNRDGSFFHGFLADDHVEVGFGGLTDKANVVAGVSSPNCVVKSYSLDRFALTVFDANTALLNYHAAQDTTCFGNAVPSPVWVSSLYVRRGDRWLNALYQQTQTRQ